MPQGSSRTAEHVPNTELEYWVAPDGNDTTGDGSESTPWATLNKAYTYLRDTAVWPGAADIAVNIDGAPDTPYQASAATVATLDPQFSGVGRKPTSSQWVIWRAVDGALPVIKPPSGLTGAKYAVRTTSTGGFVADYQQWRGLIFEGDEVIRGDGDVVGAYLSNATKFNEFIDCWSRGMRANFVANGGGAARKAQGYYIDPNANDNLFLRCKSTDIGANDGTINAQEHGFYNSGDRNKFYDVLVRDCINGYGIQVYDSGGISVGTEIANCSLVGLFKKSCIIINPNSTGARIINNILNGATEYGIEFYPGSASTGSDNVIDHILYHGNGVGNREEASPIGWTISNEQDADPLFSNEAANDFHLTATSPALSYTDTAWAGSTDIEGYTRTAGSEDAGAYEYDAGGGGGGTPTQSHRRMVPRLSLGL